MTIGSEVGQLERNQKAHSWPGIPRSSFNDSLFFQYRERSGAVMRGKDLAKELLDKFSDPDSTADFDPETGLVYHDYDTGSVRGDPEKIMRMAEHLVVYMERCGGTGMVAASAAFEIGRITARAAVEAGAD